MIMKYSTSVLLNRFPTRFSLERRLELRLSKYEEKHKVLFFTYVCFKGDTNLTNVFKIKAKPAFVFFHKGIMSEPFDDLHETKRDYIDPATMAEENADERSLQNQIKKFWDSVSENDSKSN